MSSEGYISTTDAAERLGITRQRVLQLIEKGRLPASLFANVYMIREADLKLVQDRPPGRPAKPKTNGSATSKPKKKGGKK
jgi:excisionase family DNA binding protein